MHSYKNPKIKFLDIFGTDRAVATQRTTKTKKSPKNTKIGAFFFRHETDKIKDSGSIIIVMRTCRTVGTGTLNVNYFSIARFWQNYIMILAQILRNLLPISQKYMI